MLNEMSGEQLSEWLAYARIEPWGEERADLRAGIVAATTANCHRSSRTKAFKPDDFMPKFGKTDERQVVEDVANTLKMFALNHNQRLKANDV